MDNLVTERLVLHPMSVDEAEQTVTGEPDADVRWETLRCAPAESSRTPSTSKSTAEILLPACSQTPSAKFMPRRAPPRPGNPP
ncbi:hypothetical protein ACWEIM_10930 [Streptomyces sp. NPDC004778]